MYQSTIYATQFDGEAVVVVLKNFIFIKFREACAHGNEHKVGKKIQSKWTTSNRSGGIQLKHHCVFIKFIL